MNNYSNDLFGNEIIIELDEERKKIKKLFQNYFNSKYFKKLLFKVDLIPLEFKNKLKNSQLNFLNYFIKNYMNGDKKRLIINAKCGTGKTLMLLMIMLLIRDNLNFKRLNNPILLVAPLSLLQNHEIDFLSWCNDYFIQKFKIIYLNNTEILKIKEETINTLYLTTPESFNNNLKNINESLFSVIIIDEYQVVKKNKNLMKILKTLVSKEVYYIACSGTYIFNDKTEFNYFQNFLFNWFSNQIEIKKNEFIILIDLKMNDQFKFYLKYLEDNKLKDNINVINNKYNEPNAINYPNLSKILTSEYLYKKEFNLNISAKFIIVKSFIEKLKLEKKKGLIFVKSLEIIEYIKNYSFLFNIKNNQMDFINGLVDASTRNSIIQDFKKKRKISFNINF
jgi:superfamily II DNA or RNA helicase